MKISIADFVFTSDKVVKVTTVSSIAIEKFHESSRTLGDKINVLGKHFESKIFTNDN